MKDISNTERTMKIREVLFTHTDENHELSIREIIDQLKRHFGRDYHVSKNTVKTTLRELRECGFNIEECIKENHTVYYRHHYRKKEFVLRHNGKIYTVVPLGLVWNQDYYYLVAKHPVETEIKHYRVDRMKNVRL